MSTAAISHKPTAVSWYCPANSVRNFIPDLFESNFRANRGHRSSVNMLGPHCLVHMTLRWNSHGGLGMTRSFLGKKSMNMNRKSGSYVHKRTKVKSGWRHTNILKTDTTGLVWGIQKNLPMKTVLMKLSLKGPLSAHQQAGTSSSTALCDWRHLLHWHPTVTLILCLSVFGIAKLSDATPGWRRLILPSAQNSNDDRTGSLINDW